jgi:hypothetical protein
VPKLVVELGGRGVEKVVGVVRAGVDIEHRRSRCMIAWASVAFPALRGQHEVSVEQLAVGVGEQAAFGGPPRLLGWSCSR